MDEVSGTISVAKVPSTADPIEGVIGAVQSAGVDLRDVVLFSHGTTVATNALITRRLPPAAMVTTKGFRDVIEVRRGSRDDLWNPSRAAARPTILGATSPVVTERITPEAKRATPPGEVKALEVARVHPAPG